jgi:hypothetical protein
MPEPVPSLSFGHRRTNLDEDQYAKICWRMFEAPM